MIALFHAGHARPDLGDDTRALMTQDRRENSFGIGTGEGELIGMADAGRLDLDQDFAGAWTLKVHRFEAEWFARLAGDGGARFHGIPPCSGAR